MKPANNGVSTCPVHELVVSFEFVNGINAIIRPHTGTDISSQGVCRSHAPNGNPRMDWIYDGGKLHHLTIIQPSQYYCMLRALADRQETPRLKGTQYRIPDPAFLPIRSKK